MIFKKQRTCIYLFYLFFSYIFFWNGFCYYYKKWRVHPTCCRVVVVVVFLIFFFPRAWKKFSRRHVRLQLRVTRNNTRHSLFFSLPVSPWRLVYIKRAGYLFLFSLLHPHFSFILSFMIALGEKYVNPSWHFCQTKTAMRKSVTNREIPINKILKNNFRLNLFAKKTSRSG